MAHKWFSPLSISAIMVVTSVSAKAVTVADFTGGNSSAIVDAFQGIAGSGWQGGWVMNQTNATSTGTVSNTSPLNGGGNYLAMTSTTSGTGASATGWNRRQYLPLFHPHHQLDIPRG